MRLDRSHLRWLLFTLAATAFFALLYLANAHPRSLPFPFPWPVFLGPSPPLKHTFGGTPLGLGFGVLAFALFLFASALSFRKRQRLWPLGRVRFWMRAHLWLSVLTLPLVLLHCGFHVAGRHAVWLMALYALVMASGFVGLALQQTLPRLMKDHLPREVVIEQIPRLRRQLLEGAGELRRLLLESEMVQHATTRTTTEPVAEDSSVQTLADFLDQECLPYLAAPRGGRLRLGDARRAAGVFRLLRAAVQEAWYPQLQQLERACEERRWMDLQTTFQHWLHGWLLVHVPASFALLVWTAWHGWSELRYLVSAA